MDNGNMDETVQYPLQENVSSGTNAKALMRLPIPLFVVAAYLAMGFLWDWWHPGWLIFLAIPVYYQLVSMMEAASIRKKLNRFPIGALCVLAYLLLGFFFDVWHPTWMIFLIVPLYHCFVSAVFKKS